MPMQTLTKEDKRFKVRLLIGRLLHHRSLSWKKMRRRRRNGDLRFRLNACKPRYWTWWTLRMVVCRKKAGKLMKWQIRWTSRRIQWNRSWRSCASTTASASTMYSRGFSEKDARSKGFCFLNYLICYKRFWNKKIKNNLLRWETWWETLSAVQVIMRHAKVPKLRKHTRKAS